MSSTRDIVKEQYDILQIEHGFTCALKEEPLDEHYMMVFDSEVNSIVFDPQRVEENFDEGVKFGAFRAYEIEKIILFALIHELGHYYDYQENPNAFCIGSKSEYIQMELNGMQQAKKLVPPHMVREFNEFNRIIIESYKRDLPE
ncbi:hypothetical protein ACP8HI_12450 [Paenibacillus sp. FA6]|uniref:hypothetical protein n=1 Tax=Paenibacillus sp. FA6 TaxID=3413029 RepID=UPI003F65E14D